VCLLLARRISLRSPRRPRIHPANFSQSRLRDFRVMKLVELNLLKHQEF
jgi:hypothetical protein